MARTLLERRYWERVKAYHERLTEGAISSWRTGTNVDFIDYWTDIPATIPEKMVFSELVRRQINFKFSWYIGDIYYTDEYERFRPDFILMDYKIIIEVYGVYWHTRPGSYLSDMTRAAKLTMLGYSIYTITDTEILTLGAAEVLSRIPEIATATIHGNTHMIGQRPFDPTAALRARMTRWPRVGVTKHRSPRGSIEPIESYEAQGGPVSPVPAEADPIAVLRGFTIKDWYDGDWPPKPVRYIDPWDKIPWWENPYLVGQPW